MKKSKFILQSSKGISLITLIVTIIVAIILASIAIINNNSALKSMEEAKFKAELRGMMDRLKIYHENANLESFSYKNSNLDWDGQSYYATCTGKVEDGITEDSADYIFGGVPSYFKGKIGIRRGYISIDSTKFSDDEIEWIYELGLLTNEFYEWANLEFDGDPANIINTGLKLYNNEYINSDFEITFRIDRIDSTENEITLLNLKYENGTTNPGIVLRFNSNGKLVFSARGVNNTTTTLVTKNPEDVINKDIIIKRKDGNISCALGTESEKVFEEEISTFNTPLTIGCSLDFNGDPMRCFKGLIGYVSITIFNSTEETIIEDRIQRFERYNLVCNGSNYHNSNICLYSEENINKDFRIRFKIRSLTKKGKDSTIVNSMNEADPWPGFVFRFDGNNSVLDIRSVRTSLTTKIDPSDIIGKEVSIYRTDGKLYYMIEGEIPVQVSYKAVVHNTPVTFGSSLTPTGAPQRYSIVTFDYVKVEVDD